MHYNNVKCNVFVYVSFVRFFFCLHFIDNVFIWEYVLYIFVSVPGAMVHNVRSVVFSRQAIRLLKIIVKYIPGEFTYCILKSNGNWKTDWIVWPNLEAEYQWHGDRGREKAGKKEYRLIIRSKFMQSLFFCSQIKFESISVLVLCVLCTARSRTTGYLWKHTHTHTRCSQNAQWIRTLIHR